jgi:hypothetical protein
MLASTTCSVPHALLTVYLLNLNLKAGKRYAYRYDNIEENM